MRTRNTLIAAGLAAALLGVLVSSASANRLSISHRELFRIEWASLEFGSVVVVRCAVTLEGRFHEDVISKSAGELIGTITHAIIHNEPCILGSATIMGEALPWHLRYSGFAGTLPNITKLVVNLIGARFRLRNMFTTGCIAVTTAAAPEPLVFEELIASGGAGNRIARTLSPDPGVILSCTAVEGGSSITGVLRGTGTLKEVRPEGNTGSVNVLVRLI